MTTIPRTLLSIALCMASIILLVVGIGGCGKKVDDSKAVVIYTSSDENEMAVMKEMLDAKFPGEKISLEYFPTGDQAAKLKAEGLKTECDIAYDLEYGYMSLLDKEGVFADLSAYDTSIFLDDLVVSKNFIPTIRYGGAIMVNPDSLADKGLPEPTSYADLLKPEYKGLISMPNPKASGTGYMFYYSLVRAWGEEKALQYFDALSENVLQYTPSGSGPVNALVQGEAAIALGMTSHAALQITRGHPVKILFFAEGSPYLACGAAIIKGKETSKKVQDIFRFIYTDVSPAICERLYPEQTYKGKTFKMENYPENIPYADMTGNTPAEKERLLALWPH